MGKLVSFEELGVSSWTWDRCTLDIPFSEHMYAHRTHTHLHLINVRRYWAVCVFIVQTLFLLNFFYSKKKYLPHSAVTYMLCNRLLSYTSVMCAIFGTGKGEAPCNLHYNTVYKSYITSSLTNILWWVTAAHQKTVAYIYTHTTEHPVFFQRIAESTRGGGKKSIID